MSELVERYVNKKNETVLEIFEANGSYRYNGKGSLGAGCGRDLDEMKALIFAGMSQRKLNNIIKVVLYDKC